jgi:ABC-2 type transport system ATP-binding protein
VIQIRNIVKQFPSVTALDKISLEVKEGEFFGLLGPNGAGKSTLMNLLVGYLDPDAGEIFIAGEKITRDSLETRRKIGLVPQSLALYDELSALENLEIFGSFYHIEKNILTNRVKDRLEAVQLYDRRKDKVQTFSGGMKRRLNLISSLLHDPPLLLCDEPTVGVDPQSRNAIFDYLTMLNHNESKTIVYTTHYMEEVERLCNRIAIIDFGKVIAEGTVNDLLENLTYEESIFITRNHMTDTNMSIFQQFGTIIEEQSRFELKPGSGFQLSSFFATVERHGVNPKYIELHKPTLEALFLSLTGRRLRD